MSFKPYLNQDYDRIKNECLRSGRLFEDDSFPANDSSVSRNGKLKIKDRITWKRATDIDDNPQFVVNSITPNDLDQGQLGNCWLISALAAIATVPEYLDVVVPGGQSFDRDNYAGIFHFRFWRFGEWLDVVVDDRLPTTNGNLVFCHNNQDKNEMFGPLLEKAYAKLNMCYSYLDGGESFDAMVDLTGGVHESFDVKYTPPQNDDGVDDGVKSLEPEKLWDTMYKSFFMKSLMGAAIETKGKSMEHVENNGLVLGHAYTLLSLFEILSNGQLRDSPATQGSNRSTRLIRMRNPWGQNKSFTGRWSANTREWDRISDDLKDQLNARNQNDGEFFICFEDFVQFFDELGFVHVNMNAFYDGSSGSATEYKWVCQNYSGEFIPGKNSGGCGNDDPDSYWINPQYPIQITNKKTSIIVSMIQSEQSRMRDETDGSYEKSNEAIAFSIYRCVGGNEANIKKKFSNNSKFNENEMDEICASGAYVYQRERSKRFQLDPGYYVIIPSLFEKNRKMKFLLRVFTKGSTSDPSSSNMRTYPVNSNQNDNQNYNQNDNQNYNQNDNQNYNQIYNQDDDRNYEQKNYQDDQTNRRDDDDGRRGRDDDYGRGGRGGGGGDGGGDGRHHGHNRRDGRDYDDRDRRDDDSGGDGGSSSRKGRGRRRKNYNVPSISISNITDTVVSKACLIM